MQTACNKVHFYEKPNFLMLRRATSVNYIGKS